MKQTFCIILCLLLSFSVLSGCGKEASFEHPVTFYYLSQEFSYEVQSTAIVGETREGGESATLEHLFDLYLHGPISDDLSNPFPAGLQLLSARQEGNTLYLIFSRQLANLSGLDLTIACCCIARTCLDMCDATNITIEAQDVLLGGKRNITLNKDTMLLMDQVQEPNS